MTGGLRQSKEWARFLASQGWIVEEIDGAKAYIRKLPVYGSVIKIQRPEVIPPAEAIDKLARRHHALFVKVEPLSTINNRAGRDCEDRGADLYNELSTSHGFIHDSSPNLPTKTIVIDLTKSEEELWQDLSQDARQSIKKAKSYQLLVTSYWYGDRKFKEVLRDFHQLLKRTGCRQRFWTPNLDQLRSKVGIFGKNSVLFLTYHPSSDQPIAGALNLIHGGTSYGHLAASSDTGRKLHAPYLLMWEMIKFLKNPKPHMLNPTRYFDLEGIYDPRYHKFTKSWQGFTLFKRKFGGKEVAYPQPLIKYYHPAVKLILKFGTIFD